ncbi:MAG: extracellular solute-binding protein [Turicibacter sp.]
MKMGLIKTLSFAMVMSLLLVTTGCGQDAGESNGEGNSKSESKSKEEIVFWSVFTGPDMENMNRLVDEYNKTNPTVKVKHVPVEQNDLYPKIPTVVGSGKDVPDLTIVHAERIPLFIEQDVIMPLTAHIERNGQIKKENYLSTGWDVGTVGADQYSVPLDVHSFITYYNKDLVEKYAPGILDDDKLTLEEVVMASKKAAADGITGLGMTWMRVQYLSYLAQLGADMTADGDAPTLDTPEAIEILNTLAELVEKGYASQDGEDPGQLFRSGQMLFWPEGIWMVNSIKDIPNLNFGMTHMVSLNNNTQANWTSSHQFVMLKNKKMTDERADAIMEFVNWVGENGLEWAKAGQAPAHLSIRENEEFKQMPQAFLLDDASKLALYDYKYYGYAVEALDKVVFEAIFGRMTPEEAVAQMQKETSEKIQMSK